jgi:hypothetical protein
MRTQLPGKPLFFVFVIGAFCAASVALGLGSHALLRELKDSRVGKVP